MAHVIDFKEAGFDSVLDELEWRGLISQSTDRDRLAHTLNGEPVHYYCGFDPTAPSLHIGNLVQLIIMRHLQEAGHHPIALVGGATGLIGDPRQSGERILNPKDIVEQWCERLRIQIGGILEQEGSNPVTFVSNYDWTATMNVLDFLRDIGKNFRVGTMISKDIVARRLNSEEGISFTEFSYQVLQGNDYLYLYDHYDCVLELGGSDQTFNVLMGRNLQKAFGQEQQIALFMPILEGLDGVEKMSKSLGNYIGVSEDASVMFKKVMEVPDELIIRYFELATDEHPDRVEEIRKELEQGKNPRDVKYELAGIITALYHGEEEMKAARNFYDQAFSKGAIPDDVPETALPGEKATLAEVIPVLKEQGLIQSRNEFTRLLKQGGVQLDGEKIGMEALEQEVAAGSVLKIGKKKFLRFVKA